MTTTGGAAIDGWVAPGFEPVRTAFQKNFEHGEVGAAYAAYQHGHKVVDLWGGTADATSGRPWEQDTMVLVYSSTKGVTAMCANRLAQEGRIDVDAPVATYWPEFAQVGKEGVTVADLLAHRAGLAWVDGSMTIEEALAWEPVIAALEQQAPSWPPGSAHGYHATTFGWLVGEVVRRVTGKSLGTYLREEIADPLGADFFIGLPQSQMARPARLISIVESMASKEFGSLGGASGSAPGPGLTEMAELAKTYMAPGGPLFKAIIAPGGAFADQGIWNDPALWAAEVPAANGITDARGLARLYGACVSDVETPAGGPFRLLSPEQLDRALEQRTQGPDKVLLGLDIQWGLGFMVNRGIVSAPGHGGPRAFGHFGMGGSAGWGEPDLELGMGYVMNRMSAGMAGDTRSYRLMAATVEAARQSP
ncbi:MAG: serine hydrolase domain-containing protein [Acidimicrobiales bacterium]